MAGTKPAHSSATTGQTWSWHEAMDTLLLRCPIVVSAPGVFFWAGEHAVLDGAVAVIQQVPLRVYVGLEPLGPASGQEPPLLLDPTHAGPLRDVPHHIYRSAHFAVPCDFSVRHRETNLRKVAEVANLLFKDLCRLPTAAAPGCRFRVRTASELRPGGGVNWSGAFSSALVTALLLTTNPQFRKQVTASQENGVLHWDHRRLSDLVKEQDSWFTRLHRWAWILEATFHEGAGSGYGTLAAMAPSILPLAYRRAASDRYGGEYPRSVLAKDEQFHTIPSTTLYEHLKQWLGPDASNPIPYEAFAFRDLCLGPEPDEADVEWPLTYGLIDTWWPKSTGQMIREASTIRDSALLAALEQLDDLRSTPFGMSEGADHDCFGIQGCIARQTKDSSMVRVSSHCTHLALAGDAAIVCQQMKEVLAKQDQKAASSLIASLARVHGGLEQLDLAWPAAHMVLGELGRLSTLSASGSRLSATAKLSGGGGGGYMLFALLGRAPYDMLADLESRLKACCYRVPGDPHMVSPTVMWHSATLSTEEGKRNAVPGVRIEIADLHEMCWGKHMKGMPEGSAFLLPPEGGCRRAALRLCRLMMDPYLVAARIDNSWQLLLKDQTALKRADPVFLTAAIRMVGECLVLLKGRDDAVFSDNQIRLNNKEITDLVKGYKRNLVAIARTLNLLLKGAAKIRASGQDYSTATITRTGPLGLALWQPEPA